MDFKKRARRLRVLSPILQKKNGKTRHTTTRTQINTIFESQSSNDTNIFAMVYVLDIEQCGCVFSLWLPGGFITLLNTRF